MFPKLKRPALFLPCLLAAALGALATLHAQQTPATASPATAPASIPLTTQPRADITALPPAPTAPKTLADLKLIQARVEAVVKEALPATVSIQFKYEEGSGIIVSKDGYILTAGHVSGTPGGMMDIVLTSGKRLHAKALGANNGIDSGMVKIVEPGDYPFVPVGTIKNLVAGQWVVALGHPGGYINNRPPVARLGRVLAIDKDRRAIDTDDPLISGDSGGPLFDLDGRLVGINSRIGPETTQNIHVPIDTFIDTWARLAKSDEWEDDAEFVDLAALPEPWLGVRVAPDDQGAKITAAINGGPARRAGIQIGDIITRFDGQRIKSPEDLALAVAKHHPGDMVPLTLLRDHKPTDLTVRLSIIRR